MNIEIEPVDELWVHERGYRDYSIMLGDAILLDRDIEYKHYSWMLDRLAYELLGRNSIYKPADYIDEVLYVLNARDCALSTTGRCECLIEVRGGMELTIKTIMQKKSPLAAMEASL